MRRPTRPLASCVMTGGRVIRLAVIVALAACCVGCASLEPQTVAHTDYCTPWAPIYVSKKDVLTNATAKAILAHDETGARLCGWKPKAPAKK